MTARQPMKMRARFRMAITKSGVLSRSGIFRPFRWSRQPVASALLLTLAVGLGGCSWVGLGDSDSTSEPVAIQSDYMGSVAADDPQAVEIGRRVLRDGGHAADAAAA